MSRAPLWLALLEVGYRLFQVKASGTGVPVALLRQFTDMTMSHVEFGLGVDIVRIFNDEERGDLQAYF